MKWECAFMLFLDIVDISEFTSHYLAQLAIVIYLYSFDENIIFDVQFVCHSHIGKLKELKQAPNTNTYILLFLTYCLHYSFHENSLYNHDKKMTR